MTVAKGIQEVTHLAGGRDCSKPGGLAVLASGVESLLSCLHCLSLVSSAWGRLTAVPVQSSAVVLESEG